MDANGIGSLISNVGFPVAVCIALSFIWRNRTKDTKTKPTS